jgi:glutamyl-Q tRNA(Asp) synthetase
MEDVDRLREVPGAAAGILATLEAFGFQWDGVVLRQSERHAAYRSALDRLVAHGLTFECSCSRSELAEEPRYPGHCRLGRREASDSTATRLKVEPGVVSFVDRVQGEYSQDVAHEVGDVILRRRGGLYPYLLAVVVDDAHQGVTHIVRGADLLDNTPRQIYLQRLLGLPTPLYAHVPTLVEADGSKLAKSARSVRADGSRPVAQLAHVLEILGLAPPPSLVRGALQSLWDWAVGQWHMNLTQRRQIIHLGPRLGVP